MIATNERRRRWVMIAVADALSATDTQMQTARYLTSTDLPVQAGLATEFATAQTYRTFWAQVWKTVCGSIDEVTEDLAVATARQFLTEHLDEYADWEYSRAAGASPLTSPKEE